jgi:hypothetical protein
MEPRWKVWIRAVWMISGMALMVVGSATLAWLALLLWNRAGAVWIEKVAAGAVWAVLVWGWVGVLMAATEEKGLRR